MNSSKAPAGFAVTRAAVILVTAALLQGGAAFAQCSATGSISKFEPFPIPPRLTTLNWVGINGFYLNQPSGASPRLLVTESFGYHQVDLTDPQNPAGLGWEDYRFSPTNPGPIPFSGDGHSSIDAMGISADGARAAFAVDSSADSPNGSRTMLGLTGGTGWQISLRAETPAERGGSIAIQSIGSRYLEYTLSNTAVYVSDVTNLPAALNSGSNFATETTGAPGGTSPVLAGPYLVYLGTGSSGLTNGTINLINVS
ncbi:MAG TPA: hypothetical protein VMN04_07250, partial [Thermoanaerobaculia bacterium]|nr:hypothetical protein [Thermoanaerobaculia bacterium]